MPAGRASDLKFEIGHALFINIVGYSKLLIDEPREPIQQLSEPVHGTEQLLSVENFHARATENYFALICDGDMTMISGFPLYNVNLPRYRDRAPRVPTRKRSLFRTRREP